MKRMCGNQVVVCLRDLVSSGEDVRSHRVERMSRSVGAVF